MRGARFQIASSSEIYGRRAGARVGAFVGAVVGRELSDAEIRDSAAAGRRAVDELVIGRTRMLNGWAPDALLTSAQMGPIMAQAISVAKQTEAAMVSMIDKVPSHWEKDVRDGLKHLRQAIDEAPRFAGLVEAAKQPTLIPGFRSWIDHLLSRSEDGVFAIAATAQILPHWLDAVTIVSSLHKAASGIIAALTAGAKGAAAVIDALPGALPKLAIAGVAIAGGVAIVAAIASGAKAK